MKKMQKFMSLVLAIVIFMGSSTGFVEAANGGVTPEGFDVKDDVVLVNEKNTAEALMKSGKYPGGLDDNIFGLAGNFFLTAFESVEINTHVYGNVLTRELFNNNNFGSDFSNEFSYVQDSLHGQNTVYINNNRNDARLVLGEGFEVSHEITDGNNKWLINGKAINAPQHNNSYNLWQDNTKKFIDLDEIEKGNVCFK